MVVRVASFISRHHCALLPRLNGRQVGIVNNMVIIIRLLGF